MQHLRFKPIFGVYIYYIASHPLYIEIVVQNGEDYMASSKVKKSEKLLTHPP